MFDICTRFGRTEKTLKQSEKRIAELDSLFIKFYEDNVSGKISDARFEMMSQRYEGEQENLKKTVSDYQHSLNVQKRKIQIRCNSWKS
ncbi:MAG: hypothetical protein K2G36_00405 [Ruminococcus sp.]|nr:hypothetical protein [Ruminococcus sp.]